MKLIYTLTALLLLTACNPGQDSDPASRAGAQDWKRKTSGSERYWNSVAASSSLRAPISSRSVKIAGVFIDQAI